VGDLAIPVLNATDDEYVLVEWLVMPGVQVAAGEPVALVETSKAVNEVVATEAGFLVPRVAPGSVCRPGEAIGSVSATATDAAGGTSSPDAAPVRDGGHPAGPAGRLVSGPDAPAQPVISRAAQELIDEHDIAPDAIMGLGKRVIKRADVESLLRAAPPPTTRVPDGQRPSAHQRAIALAVSRSHATIPAAFTMMKVDGGELSRRLRRAGEQAHAFIGPVEHVITGLAKLRPRFPYFFARVDDDLTVHPSDHTNIGVTIDVGRGLFVPVIRDADQVDLEGIAAALMNFRVRAMRRTITDAELNGGCITLTLHLEPGVVLARPVVFPGQTCALSLCAQQRELRLDSAGQVACHEYFHLGIAYDHRVINGADAIRFLAAMRDELESPPEALSSAPPGGKSNG
jgi:2-oxoglutarate dehydrogenase E2 component (dihydrolipoamide succinyltransferase)